MKPFEEQAKVKEAFINGEPIEFTEIGKDSWKDANDPVWDWDRYDYRLIQNFDHIFKIGDEIIPKNAEGRSIDNIHTIEDMCFDRYYTKYPYDIEDDSWGEHYFSFKEQEQWILVKDVLWYWEVKYHSTGEWGYLPYRFKTEEEARNFYRLDEKDSCKRIMSLGFIIPKQDS